MSGRPTRRQIADEDARMLQRRRVFRVVADRMTIALALAGCPRDAVLADRRARLVRATAFRSGPHTADLWPTADGVRRIAAVLHGSAELGVR